MIIMTLVTPVPSHYKAHLRWSKHVDTAKLAYKFRRVTTVKAFNPGLRRTKKEAAKSRK